MHVANLELCKVLYELSGWESEASWWKYNSEFYTSVDDEDDSDFASPAYDLGYLLRKLPLQHEGRELVVNADKSGWWYIGYPGPDGDFSSGPYGCEPQPEDAACNLAIELFKQGILGKE